MKFHLALFHLVGLLTATGLWSQIVNIESERIKGDLDGWAGKAKLSFALTRNNDLLYNFNGDLHTQYRRSRHLFLIIGQSSWIKVEGDDFSKLGFGHLRYNYRLNAWLRLEGFLQGQFNKIALLDFRGLAGAGLRFKLSQNDRYRVYLGFTPMLEYEEENSGIIYRNFRQSNYLSLTFLPAENFKLIATTYFQPLLNTLDDYRISSETALEFKINTHISFHSSYRFFYDNRPPETAPQIFYNLLTGIGLAF